MKSIPTELVPSLNAFLIAVNAAYEIYWNRSKFIHNVCPQIRVSNVGAKYAKLAVFERQSDERFEARSVYCFLDITNGDMLKGSWKAPVNKGVRGNLKDANLLEKFTIHGPAYLTGGGCFDSIARELKNSNVIA